MVRSPRSRRAAGRRWRLFSGVLRSLRGLLAATALIGVVFGLPWGLVHVTGWPLPTRLPSWAQVQAVLLNPMTSEFLLDFLACACWSSWGLFTADVLRCVVTVVRGVRLPKLTTTGPLHRAAAALVSTLLLSLLGEQAGSASVTTSAGTASTAVNSFENTTIGKRGSGAAASVVVRVPDPSNGTHDSLWRIAERALGDGGRWPEVFELNKGKQRVSGTFDDPNLIFPGEELLVPGAAATVAPAPQELDVLPPQDVRDNQTPERTGMPENAAPPPPDEAGVSWEHTAFVGAVAASVAGSAVVLARRRRGRRYLPGSGDRADQPDAPVVYGLRMSQQHVDQDEARSEQQDRNDAGLDSVLNLAASQGLGLVGAGTTSAARALLITALSTASEDAAGTRRVLTTAGDLTMLVGRRTTKGSLSPGLHGAVDLDAALDELEAEILARAGTPSTTNASWPTTVLVTRVPDRQLRRLRAVLDNGRSVGVIGVLLGQWPSGVTAHVGQDGTVSSTSPPNALPHGTNLFGPGDDNTAALSSLLHEVASERAAQPGTPADNRVEALPPPPAEAGPQAAQEPAEASTGERRENSPDVREHRSSQNCEALAPCRISVLGPLRVWWRRPTDATGQESIDHEITSAFQPRVRELLVYLALHPGGVSREALASALWATSPPGRTTNAMNTTLTRLRRALATATDGALADVVVCEGRYRLAPELVEVDHHHFAAAVAATRCSASAQERIAAHRAVVDHYTGPLADGMSSDWLETARESSRRDALDAVAALARELVGQDPQQTLDLLEWARELDPNNDLLYRDIMRVQDRLGRADAIPRTLALLTARLAELGEQPMPETVDLADRLLHRQEVRRIHLDKPLEM